MASCISPDGDPSIRMAFRRSAGPAPAREDDGVGREGSHRHNRAFWHGRRVNGRDCGRGQGSTPTPRLRSWEAPLSRRPLFQQCQCRGRERYRRPKRRVSLRRQRAPTRLKPSHMFPSNFASGRVRNFAKASNIAALRTTGTLAAPPHSLALVPSWRKSP
jgi:hypothetical protein